MRGLVICIAMLFTQFATAAVTINIFESGGNVQAVLTGNLNLGATGGLFGAGPGYNGYHASLGGVGFTTGTTQTYNIDIANWTSFGSGGFDNWDSSSGDAVTLYTNPLLGVPDGYVSGAPLSATATKNTTTLAALGFTAGTYVTTLTGDGDSDTVTVIVGAAPTFDLTVTKALRQQGFPDLFLMDADGTLGIEAGHGATSTAQVSYDDTAYIDEVAGAGTDLNYWNAAYDCDYPDGASFGVGDGHRFDFTMPASNLECTIINDRKRVPLTLVVKSIGFDGEFCFDMIDSFGTPKPFTCITTSGGYGSLGPIDWYAGTVSFFEVIDGEYILQSAVCSNGDNPEEVVNLIPDSEPVTCTWVNVLPTPVPANKIWALFLLFIMILGVGWYYRPVTVHRH